MLLRMERGLNFRNSPLVPKLIYAQLSKTVLNERLIGLNFFNGTLIVLYFIALNYARFLNMIISINLRRVKESQGIYIEYCFLLPDMSFFWTIKSVF